MIRKHILFSGHVQGVGFRYTSEQIAGSYDVGGYVRNLPDGRVEVVVEGEPQTVQAYLDSLTDAMSGHIRDTQVNEQPYQGEFTDFGVRF